LTALRNAINARWPNRDRTSDGTIGDAAHATRASDHNPWIVVNGAGVVRALDVDRDGIDAAWLAEQLRLLGAAGDARLTGGGYVIYNRRITRADWAGWSVYTGSNPHTAHVHVSFSRGANGFDDARGWSFLSGGSQPASGRPTLQLGSKGDAVRELQRTLNAWYPSMARLTIDGDFGTATKARVTYVQRRLGLEADGIVGPRTWAALGFK
jgi:hypothetical protein